MMSAQCPTGGNLEHLRPYKRRWPWPCLDTCLSQGAMRTPEAVHVHAMDLIASMRLKGGCGCDTTRSWPCMQRSSWLCMQRQCQASRCSGGDHHKVVRGVHRGSEIRVCQDGQGGSMPCACDRRGRSSPPGAQGEERAMGACSLGHGSMQPRPWCMQHRPWEHALCEPAACTSGAKAPDYGPALGACSQCLAS